MNGLVQRPVSTQRQLRKGLLRNLAQDLDGSSALLSHCYCQILTPFEPNFIYLPVLQSILTVVSPSYFLTNTLEPRRGFVVTKFFSMPYRSLYRGLCQIEVTLCYTIESSAFRRLQCRCVFELVTIKVKSMTVLTRYKRYPLQSWKWKY